MTEKRRYTPEERKQEERIRYLRREQEEYEATKRIKDYENKYDIPDEDWNEVNDDPIS